MQQINALDLPRTLAEFCHPSRMAFLVYDMQVGICSQIKTRDHIVERVGSALEAARSAGLRVVFTRHLSLPKSWMGRTQYRTGMAWQRTDDPAAVKPWFLRDSEAFQIIPELVPRPEEAVFDKLAMSAFDGTPLGYALHDCGLQALAIAGIATEIGIEPTARQAIDHGIVPVVITDACGAGHAEAGVRAVETMRFIGETLLTDVKEFAAALSQSVK